jgi:hypothetical protein
MPTMRQDLVDVDRLVRTMKGADAEVRDADAVCGALVAWLRHASRQLRQQARVQPRAGHLDVTACTRVSRARS